MSEYGYLAHYGVQGMKWGVRNYQNPDGSLTSAGKARYRIGMTGKVHNSNMIYSTKDNNEGYVRLYRRGSIQSGRVASGEKSRISRLMKKDIKSEMKSGKMSKEEGQKRLKNVKTDVDHILRKQLGNSSVNAINKYRNLVIANTVADVLLLAGGVAVTAYMNKY